MKTIAVENSTWNNIGDAFYQISLQQMLEHSFSDCNVVSFDGPPGRAFRPRRFARNMFDVRAWCDADHYVLSGPILGRQFINAYGDFIREIIKRDRSYSLMSVHAEAGGPIEEIREFLRAYPPKAIHTRDHATYVQLNDLSVCKLDGNCFAFFVYQVKGIPRLAPTNDYICSSFHSMPEPVIHIDRANSDDFLTCGLRVDFSRKNYVPWKFARHFDIYRKYPRKIGSWDLVRPVHGFYSMPHVIFGRPDSYITYNPLNFLAIYKYCQGVVTDRVHAGVVTLSFGHPAYVTRLDSRYDLFEAANVEKQANMLHLPRETLDLAYERHLNWLKSDFAKAIAG